MSLQIPATIEGVIFESSEATKSYVPSEKTKERIANLGLEQLQKDEKDMTFGKFLKELEVAVWKSAANVKKRQLGYKKDDYLHTLNFLELFCLFCAQTHWLHDSQIKREGGSSLITTRIDKPVLKAVHEIETIIDLVGSDIKYNKILMKKHLERLNHLVNKIFTNDLSQSEQRAFSKIVDKAQKILKNIAT